MKQEPQQLWQSLFLMYLLVAFAYMFLEWLFIVTQPSFLNALGFLDNLEILFFSSLLLYAITAPLLILLMVIGLISPLRQYTHILTIAGVLLPAVLLGLLSLLLVDNFTYTVFRFGIVTSQGAVRAIYAVLFLFAVGLWWRYLVDKLKVKNRRQTHTRLQKAIIPGLILAIFLPAPIIANTVYIQRLRNVRGPTTTRKLPNILYITSDALSATSLSLYGYERDTTPNLREMADVSLVAENAFTNAGATTGSLVSIYTSKSPFRTGVIYPPNILRGADAYQHLPGILKSMGYTTAQFSLAHYADGISQNVLEGFDQVNGESASEIGQLASLNRFLPIDLSNFLSKLYQRASERLGHIFYTKEMENPYLEAINPPKDVAQKRKLTASLKLLNDAKQPVFIHVHLMGTHGPRYGPTEQVFSAGQEVGQQENWNVDFYDDEILRFDQWVGTTIKALDRNGLLEDTVVVIGSDHGKRWNSLQRIPLLIRFPNGEHAGVIKTNVQNLDIAPTILDYLGLAIPEWMEGESLFRLGENQRLIISATNIGVNQIYDETGRTELDTTKLGPPFYQFGTISVVKCQKWYRLYLRVKQGNFETGDVKGHTAPCKNDELLTNQEAFDLMVEHLKSNGFDVSSLKDFQEIPTQQP
jgi:arylsulfatase A-like enzyme